MGSSLDELLSDGFDSLFFHLLILLLLLLVWLFRMELNIVAVLGLFLV